MHPHTLHARAAAHSLHAARTRLAELARDEARRNTDTLMAAAPILRAPVYGQRLSGGGHGDPVSGLLTALGRPARVTTWAERLDRLDGKLRWLANAIGAPGLDLGLDPLALVMTALPMLQPGTARVVAWHLLAEEKWVRGTIGQPRPTQPLPGVACPHCDERQLVVQTAGPVEAWTVVCTTGRLCSGEGCPCGMEGAVEGVGHIWPRDTVLGAVAGAAPTQPTN